MQSVVASLSVHARCGAWRIAVALCFIAVCGCFEEKPPERLVVHFPMVVALVDSVGMPGEPLSDDLVSLFTPLESCRDRLFVPDVKIARLDIRGENSEELDLGSDSDWIMDLLGIRPDTSKAREVRRMALDTMVLTSLMSRRKGDSQPAAKNVRRLIKMRRSVYLIGDTQNLGIDTVDRGYMVIAGSLDSVRSRLGNDLCRERVLDDERGITVIIYTHVDSSHTPVPIPPPPSPATPCDSLSYDTLAKRARRILNGDTTISQRAVDAQLAKGQAEHSWDYRFSYERAKLAVYGVHRHDEAFYLLNHAAEIAMENGDADDMVIRLYEDGPDKRPLWKLAHGHEEWEELLAALPQRDTATVRGWRPHEH